jgi:hypothetical protein
VREEGILGAVNHERRSAYISESLRPAIAVINDRGIGRSIRIVADGSAGIAEVVANDESGAGRETLAELVFPREHRVAHQEDRRVGGTTEAARHGRTGSVAGRSILEAKPHLRHPLQANPYLIT